MCSRARSNLEVAQRNCPRPASPQWEVVQGHGRHGCWASCFCGRTISHLGAHTQNSRRSGSDLACAQGGGGEEGGLVGGQHTITSCWGWGRVTSFCFQPACMSYLKPGGAAASLTTQCGRTSRCLWLCSKHPVYILCNTLHTLCNTLSPHSLLATQHYAATAAAGVECTAASAAAQQHAPASTIA